MKTGVVKWFNAEKGYGFITEDETGVECFVHYTAIQNEGFKALRDKDKVTYDTKIDSRDTNKLRAINVNLAHKNTTEE